MSFHSMVFVMKRWPRKDLSAPLNFDGFPEKGQFALETARFEVLPGGRTRVTIQSVFQSVNDRDGMVQSGMEEGINESHERLDELLEDM